MTVTGPGGAGKTRLAGEVAEQVAGRFADGVWLAELAPVRDPALVPAVVAAALGVREQPGMPSAAALARVLARRQVLLVLDNCEHVIGVAAGLCAGLLLAADDVRVLATSRGPLGWAGRPGTDWRRSPCLDRTRWRTRRTARRWRCSPPGPAGLTCGSRWMTEACPVVAWLVARLDGMPLAIDLAAARVEALALVEYSFDLLDEFLLF